MTPITSSAASDTDSARHFVSGRSSASAFEDRPPTAVGQVHVEQHDVGLGRRGSRRSPRRRCRLADDVDGITDLGLHTGTEQRVIVDDEHADCEPLIAAPPAPTRCRHPARSPARRAHRRVRCDRESTWRCRDGRRRSSDGEKPTPLSRTKAVIGVRLDLDVDADEIGAGVLGGVDGCLANGEQQRVDRRRDLDIADHDQIDRQAVIQFDLGGDASRPGPSTSRPPRWP